jgi:excisionase family DNA binding protein
VTTEFYSFDEAADVLRVNTELLRKAARIGALKHFRVGNAYRATGQQILDWLENGGAVRSRDAERMPAA